MVATASAAGHPGQRQVQALEQFFDQVGAFDQITHEDEQRESLINTSLLITLHRRAAPSGRAPGRTAISVVDAAVAEPAKKHAHTHQREGGRKTQHDGHHHQTRA